jgi:hypothetical protein
MMGPMGESDDEAIKRRMIKQRKPGEKTEIAKPVDTSPEGKLKGLAG